MKSYYSRHSWTGIVGCWLAFGAQAQSSAALELKGQIRPSACSISVADSLVDFGQRRFVSLNPFGTILAGQTTTLEIICDSPKLVSFSASDNRAGSAISTADVRIWPKYVTSYNDAHLWDQGVGKVFGLGRTREDRNSPRIGALAIALDTPGILLNGAPLSRAGAWLLRGPKAAPSASWGDNTRNSQVVLATDQEYTFGSAPRSSEVRNGRAIAVTTIRVPMLLQAVIASRSSLAPSDEILLDGSLTFTLRYL